MTSKVSKATVIAAEGNGARFVFGDSSAANPGPVVIRRTNSGDAGAAASGTAFAITTSRTDDGPAGVFGTGYSMTDIASIGVRRFTTGQLGTNAIIVSVVKLK